MKTNHQSHNGRILKGSGAWCFVNFPAKSSNLGYPIGSMYAIYGNIYHQYTSNASIYTIHGSYGYMSPSNSAKNRGNLWLHRVFEGQRKFPETAVRRAFFNGTFRALGFKMRADLRGLTHQAPSFLQLSHEGYSQSTTPMKYCLVKRYPHG